MEDLKIGDPCPDFDLPSTTGTNVSRGNLLGRAFVLFFYPRDNTSGCTREAQEFSAAAPDFADLNVDIFGVSRDTLASHEKFIAKQDLSVPLLSDADSDLCEKVGCWKEKSNYGRTYMGIERTTVLVDSGGKVRNIWRKVRVPGHVEEVLTAARSL